ncbi:MAG TPA: hypothetical protein PLA61_10420 [Ferruginibacter sp.]|jgi:hypothetical protein|nr:hypothetical protein [Ferruginibacter sp.]HMU73167.1 hypothetical protein [Ferruginibacter sp.]HQR01248.1 hypothetical protein [Ferruginibacter sp.]
MKRMILSFWAALFAIAVHAQSSCGIVRAWAYFTVSMPGAQMVDDNGNPVPPVPNVNRFIYVECAGGKKPVIGQVVYNEEMFAATVVATTGGTISPGKRNSDEKDIRLKARKGNRIWKIELRPNADKPQNPEACKNIRLQGIIAGKNCVFRIPASELQLYTPPAY